MRSSLETKCLIFCCLLMKRFVFFILTLIAFKAHAQQTPLPHGMVFGSKPDTSIIVEAANIDQLMGKKIRVSTTLRGRVINVDKQKGGWFTLDAGRGTIISAHFKNYDVTLPAALKGRVVIIEGIANRQVSATNGQQFGGKISAKQDAYTPKNKPLIFEVTGLMVYK